MGDFDKVQGSKGAAEKKKLVVVFGLGAILLGMGAFHYMKSTPATAAAAIPTGSDVAAPLFSQSVDETAAQAKAALENDPTANLLRGSGGIDPILDAVPRNPFRIAPEWETTLVKRIDEVPTAETPHIQAFAAPTSAPRLVDLTTLKLTGIFRQDQKLYAIINGDIYTTGMAVDNARILDITSNKVTLQRVESLNGPKATLAIDPKLK